MGACVEEWTEKGKRLRGYVPGGVGKSTSQGVYEGFHGSQGSSSSSTVLEVRYYGTTLVVQYLIRTYPAILYIHMYVGQSAERVARSRRDTRWV